ncbi:hypothetical protein [Novispirillum itersonii]|uniref:hypothetical protein n=1 Tax=Novispirillum itersonii TaxID=189 RepID=UPI000372D8F9|nr:hypothetical protein [Novispirillum itersonii]
MNDILSGGRPRPLAGRRAPVEDSSVSLSDLLGPDPDVPVPPPTTVAQVRQAMREVATVIVQARRALNEDRMPSLHDLDQVVRRACRIAQDLPVEYRHEAANDLETVLYDLDVLTVDLTTRFGGLALRPEAALACAPSGEDAADDGLLETFSAPDPLLLSPVTEDEAPPRSTDPYRRPPPRRPPVTSDEV